MEKRSMTYAERVQEIEEQRVRQKKERIEAARRRLEDGYIEGILEGKTRGLAAKDADWGSAARKSPRKLIETPELKLRLQEALMEQQVTLPAIVRVVADGMTANVVSKSKFGVESTDIPDHGQRLKASEQASKLWGLGQDERKGYEGSAVSVTLSGPLAERFAAFFGPKDE